MPSFEEFSREIKSLWDSHWLTNMGVKHQQLEIALQQYLDTPNITLYSNGHLALESIIEGLNLQGEVITTPFTFASTTHAIVRKGLTPVFADIRPDNYTIQTDQLERLITERTSAILPVHVYGNICDIDEIARLAEKYNLKVIYDAAHAFGITVNGEGVANFGDASMFSFHSTKVFNTIEGGAITYSDSNLRNVLNGLKNFGITAEENIEYVGGNAKMNEFQAAMGLCNLRYVDREISKRKRIFERYVEQLENLKGITLSTQQNGVESNYSYFPVLFNGPSTTRDVVMEELKKHNIFSRKYFYPLTTAFECYQDRFTSHHAPVAEYISERILTLPLYADLTLDEVDRICSIIKNSISIHH